MAPFTDVAAKTFAEIKNVAITVSVVNIVLDFSILHLRWQPVYRGKIVVVLIVFVVADKDKLYQSISRGQVTERCCNLP